MLDTPPPTPAACAVPNAPPHAIAVVRPVGAEKYIEANHKSGVVDIKVFLGPDGTVTKAIVYRSSGDTFLDGATYDAAIATAYAPEIRDCQPIAGAYIYRTKYNVDSGASAPASAPTPAPAPALTPAPAPTPAATVAPQAGPAKSAVTMAPTMIPTTIATSVPTSYPTTLVTSVPTTVATTVPTTVPTTVATTVPTNLPTSVPTTIATSVATSVPTTIATTVPGTVQTTVPNPSQIRVFGGTYPTWRASQLARPTGFGLGRDFSR